MGFVFGRVLLEKVTPKRNFEGQIELLKNGKKFRGHSELDIYKDPRAAQAQGLWRVGSRGAQRQK